MSISRALHAISCFVRAEFVVLLLALLMSSSTRADPSSDYLLAPGDTIKLDILDDDEIPVDLPVGPDGAIQAPFVGGVRVAGLTLADAVKELERSYVEKRIFVVPKVSISVAAYRPVFVIGDVRLPGSYPFQPQLTVEKALGLAGGQLQATSTENPVLASARLRQELDLAEADIIREALACRPGDRPTRRPNDNSGRRRPGGGAFLPGTGRRTRPRGSTAHLDGRGRQLQLANSASDRTTGRSGTRVRVA